MILFFIIYYSVCFAYSQVIYRLWSVLWNLELFFVVDIDFKVALQFLMMD